MKLLIKNEGDLPITITQRAKPVGNSGDPGHDNGIKQTLVEPNGFAHLDTGDAMDVVIADYTDAT
jgi:hypothetical protein